MTDDGIFTFDYAAWALLFPQFVAPTNSTPILEPTATAYFGIAELYLSNQPWSQICCVAKRGLILNLLTAHIAALFGVINGQAVNPLVGRITQATEGSVSVSVDFPTNPNAAWFFQTPFGAAAWQAMAPWRTALYIAAPQVPLAAQSWPGSGSAGWGYGGPFGGPFGAMQFGGMPWPRC